jgi:hypothetical protein
MIRSLLSHNLSLLTVDHGYYGALWRGLVPCRGTCSHWHRRCRHRICGVCMYVYVYLSFSLSLALFLSFSLSLSLSLSLSVYLDMQGLLPTFLALLRVCTHTNTHTTHTLTQSHAHEHTHMQGLLATCLAPLRVCVGVYTHTHTHTHTHAHTCICRACWQRVWHYCGGGGRARPRLRRRLLPPLASVCRLRTVLTVREHVL